jgi:hypothetical protein
MCFFARQGEFAPEVSVNVIDFDITPGSLDSFGGAYGGQVTQASFGTFAGGETYIIKLGEPSVCLQFWWIPLLIIPFNCLLQNKVPFCLNKVG